MSSWCEAKTPAGSLACRRARRLWYHWLIAFTGQPLTRIGARPGWFEVTAARLFNPMSTDATRDGSTSAGVGRRHCSLIDHLHGVVGSMRHDPHLVNGRLAGLDT